MKVKKIIDISLPISGSMLVYPGNAAPKLEFTRKIPGKSILSAITLGSHTGTHVDARMHVRHGAVKETIEKIPLEAFVGECRVLDLTKVKGNAIGERHLRKFKLKKNKIILLKTKNSLRGFKKFTFDYVYVDESAAAYCAKAGIRTIGVDYLSVQKPNSGNYRVHELLLDNKITIFEGLNLAKAKGGKYFFAGLPLNVVGAEGAPARCVLLEV
jgi:arylformamidase